MHKSKRLFHGRTGLCLAAALILMMTLFALPLQARTARSGDGQGIIGDVRDGIRDFGRDVSDMVDPDGDGILPDGSLDNGIADDGAQNLPDGSTDMGDALLPDESTPTDSSTAPSEGTDLPATSGDAANGTDHAPGTSAPVTTDSTDTSENADSGFRWSGLIIALVIAAAVVLLIVLLIPRRKD